MSHGFGAGKSFPAAFLLVLAPCLLCANVLCANKRKNDRPGAEDTTGNKSEARQGAVGE